MREIMWSKNPYHSMNRQSKMLFFLLAMVFSACAKHNDFRDKLDTAEALMYEYPDSAYEMLRDMNGIAKNVPSSLQMKHLLLLGNAQNKADIPFTTDSIGKVLAEYYRNHGTANERMLAHYVQGCAYRDMMDWPSAVRCFNDAIAAADTTTADCDFRQLSITFGQLAFLCENQYLLEEALQAYRNAERYARDTFAKLNYKTYISDVLFKKGDIQQGLELIDSIISTYQAQGDYKSVAVAKGKCIKWYARQNDFVKAVEAMEDYEHHSGFFLPNGDIEPGREEYYNIKGVFYEEKGVPDSAEYYFRKLQRMGTTVNSQYLSSLGLTRLYCSRHITDSIAKYAWHTFLCYDSLYNHEVAQNLQEAQAKYNYERHREIAHKKEIEAKETQIRLRNIIIVGTILLSMAIIAIMVYRRRLHTRTVNFEHKIHLQQTHHAAVIETLKNEIEEKTQSISILNNKLDENTVNRQESEKMAQTISILKQQIQKHKRDIELLVHSQQSSKLHEESVIVNFINKVKLGKERPNREEWQRVCILVESHHPDMLKIKNNKDISTQEYRICILIKLGLKVSDIVFVEEITNSNLTNIRSRMLKKIFGVKGGAKDFDRYMSGI